MRRLIWNHIWPHTPMPVKSKCSTICAVGKFGINSLYEHFFTGLATPEEIFHMLDYAQMSGRQNGFRVDSAGQTDEPSVTWAFPQILAAAGIKYYANGSDPIRDSLNPIGLLNFHSPFYW